jgi:hypothetical protein
MKYYIISTISFLLLMNLTWAQPPIPDTVWGGTPWQNQVLRAPVVTGQSAAINIVPSGGALCFDKQVKLKITKGSTVFEQCLYINTRDGYIGYLPPMNSAGGGLCDIKPQAKDFLFFVIGLKGNVYTYKTMDKGSDPEFWVSTGNTQTHQYNMTASNGTVTLHKKTETKMYCGNKIRAWAYKYDGSPEVYFMFGKTYPPAINVSSSKYLGNFGIGYQETDKGLYMIMEMQSTGYTSKITDVNEVNTCFDPRPFRIIEDEFMIKRTAELQKEREKIDREESRIRGDDECAGFRRNIIVFKKAQLRIQEQGLQTIPQGNAYQTQNVQQAYMNMMDPLFMVQGNILETQLSICNTEVALRGSPSSNETISKLACLQGQLGRLHTAEEQMSALDAQYAAQPAKAMGEKSRIYLQLMRTACN